MAADIDFRIVKTKDLPPRFQPSTGENRRSAQQQVEEYRDALPDPFWDVLERVTEDLTKREKVVLLDRLETDSEDDLRGSGRSKEEWRDMIANGLKREANRFMAAAATVRTEGSDGY